MGGLKNSGMAWRPLSEMSPNATYYDMNSGDRVEWSDKGEALVDSVTGLLIDPNLLFISDNNTLERTNVKEGPTILPYKYTYDFLPYHDTRRLFKVPVYNTDTLKLVSPEDAKKFGINWMPELVGEDNWTDPSENNANNILFGSIVSPTLMADLGASYIGGQLFDKAYQLTHNNHTMEQDKVPSVFNLGYYVGGYPLINSMRSKFITPKLTTFDYRLLAGGNSGFYPSDIKPVAKAYAKKLDNAAAEWAAKHNISDVGKISDKMYTTGELNELNREYLERVLGEKFEDEAWKKLVNTYNDTSTRGITLPTSTPIALVKDPSNYSAMAHEGLGHLTESHLSPEDWGVYDNLGKILNKRAGLSEPYISSNEIRAEVKRIIEQAKDGGGSVEDLLKLSDGKLSSKFNDYYHINKGASVAPRSELVIAAEKQMKELSELENPTEAQILEIGDLLTFIRHNDKLELLPLGKYNLEFMIALREAIKSGKAVLPFLLGAGAGNATQ